MITWVVFLGIGLVAGIGIGIYLNQMGVLRSKKQIELEAQLHQARDNLQQYKQDVARHFVQTSGLINNMTQSYRAVFEHLSDGAKRLCGDDYHELLLDPPPAQPLVEQQTVNTNSQDEQPAVIPAVAAANTKPPAAGNATSPQTGSHAERRKTPAADQVLPEAAGVTVAEDSATEATPVLAAEESVTQPEIEMPATPAAADKPAPSPAGNASDSKAAAPAAKENPSPAAVDSSKIKTVSESELPNDEHADYAGEQETPPATPLVSNSTVH